jgi:hypothetical protein
MSGAPRAMEPEEVTRLVVERLNAAAAALCEPQAVLAYPADRRRSGVRRSGRCTSRWSTPGYRSASRRRCPPSGLRTWR